MQQVIYYLTACNISIFNINKSGKWFPALTTYDWFGWSGSQNVLATEMPDDCIVVSII